MYRLAADRKDFEQSLAAGNVYVHVGGERYWQARRSGKTKFWPSRPLEFSVPIKMGFRDHARVTHNEYKTDSVRIATSRDEAEGRR